MKSLLERFENGEDLTDYEMDLLEEIEPGCKEIAAILEAEAEADRLITAEVNSLIGKYR
jgi:hypothetical protein